MIPFSEGSHRSERPPLTPHTPVALQYDSVGIVASPRREHGPCVRVVTILEKAIDQRGFGGWGEFVGCQVHKRHDANERPEVGARP